MDDLSSDTLAHAAAFLNTRDHDAMMRAGNWPLANAARPFVRSAQITAIDAHQVHALPQFRALLGPGVDATQHAATVAGLPAALQTPPLAALGGRIMALPPHEQAVAVREFLALASRTREVEFNPMLHELSTAARGGAEGLRQRETLLISPAGAAAAAVQAGENVQQVVRRMAISGPDSIESLEGRVMNNALESIGRGGTLAAVAQRLGITSGRRLDELERHATARFGLPAVARGEAPSQVAARLGITAPQEVGRLNLHAARRMVQQGQNLHVAAAAFGIGGQLHALRALEFEAVTAFGASTAQRGENVREMAAHMGIDSPRHLNALERIAIDEYGADAVRRGEPVTAVAARLGIQNPANLVTLSEFAPEQTPAKRARW